MVTATRTEELQRVSDNVVQELSDIVEAGERPARSAKQEAKVWYVRMPMAGVRYYSFSQRDAA